jgi:hypothetical protein
MLSPTARGMTGGWQQVLGAVMSPVSGGGRGSQTTFIWESWRQSYLSIGLTPPRASLSAMGELVSRATAIRTARNTLADTYSTWRATGSDQALTGRMAAPGLLSRDVEDQPNGPSYRAVVEMRALGLDGEEIRQHVTWTIGNFLPTSISEFHQGLTEAALGAAEDYGFQFLGLSSDPVIMSY